MKVQVIITLKKNVLDPQGKVIQQTLDSMGFDNISEVRQGKFLPCNATLCEECSSLYPANENLFQIQLANSVTRSCSTVNANL